MALTPRDPRARQINELASSGGTFAPSAFRCALASSQALATALETLVVLFDPPETGADGKAILCHAFT
jgi:hypothetical protein